MGRYYLLLCDTPHDSFPYEKWVIYNLSLLFPTGIYFPDYHQR